MAELQTLLDNKKEYLEHLNDILAENLTILLKNMYSNVATKNNSLQEFQLLLEKIPHWNHIEIENLYNTILEKSQCTYLTDLVHAIIATQIKILSLSHDIPSIKKLKIKVPSIQNFIHKCLIASARNIWKKPYLFYHKVRSIELQHNLNQIEEIIIKSINQVIRSCIPYNNIFTLLGHELSEKLDLNSNEDSESQADSESDSDSDSEVKSESETSSEQEPKIEQEPEPKPELEQEPDESPKLESDILKDAVVSNILEDDGVSITDIHENIASIEKGPQDYEELELMSSDESESESDTKVEKQFELKEFEEKEEDQKEDKVEEKKELGDVQKNIQEIENVNHKNVATFEEINDTNKLVEILSEETLSEINNDDSIPIINDDINNDINKTNTDMNENTFNNINETSEKENVATFEKKDLLKKSIIIEPKNLLLIRKNKSSSKKTENAFF